MIKEGRKVFFFEKRKTYAFALPSPHVKLAQLARNQTDRSFLVLFFKKEHSSFLMARASI